MISLMKRITSGALVLAVAMLGLSAVQPNDSASAAEAKTYTDITFAWEVSESIQKKSHSGKANYLSAGISDGTKSTYAATAPGVKIIQRDVNGKETTSSYEKPEHHTVDDSAKQLVQLTGGKAEVAADGSALVTWAGSFTVNYYDGMVPFSFENVRLAVAKNGSGALKADMSGYGSDQNNPYIKEPIAKTKDVVVAEFANVKSDFEKAFVITPKYDGVKVTGVSQNQTVTGWGSWPQSFINFMDQTGLVSFFYSSGGSSDKDKKPSAIQISAGNYKVDAKPVKPTLSVKPTVAKTVKATVGAWKSDYKLTYQWLANGKNIKGATKASYKPAAGVAGKKLAVKVTAVSKAHGTKYTVTSKAAKVQKAAAKVTVKAKALKKQSVKLTVKVSLPGTKASATKGTLKVYDGKKLVKKVKIKKGKAAVTLKKLKKGNHTFKVTYDGSKAYKKKSANTKLKIK